MWHISQEGFFNAGWVDRLSLRATYGITGMTPNVNVGGPYDMIVDGGTANFFYGDVENLALLLYPANNRLAWEKTRNLNLAVDYSLWGGRVSGSADVYFKRTSDLIAPVMTDPSSGFSEKNMNVANIRNAGVELAVNTRNIVRRDFDWSTAFNFAYNKSEVTDVFSPPVISNYVSGTRPVFVEGKPAYALYSYRYAGLDEQGEPMVWDAEGNKTAEMIDDVGALVYSGTAQPPVSGGMTNTLRYKGFTLDFQIIYNLGHKMRRDVAASNMNRRVAYNQTQGNESPWINPLHNDYKNAWTPSNTETMVPRWSPTGSRTTREYYPSGDINLVSASYISLSDITLSYALPAGLLSRIGVGACTLSAQVHDPLLWTRNNDGIDPRCMSSMTGFRRALKYGPEYMFRLNIQF
jgi:hypothetical protein